MIGSCELNWHRFEKIPQNDRSQRLFYNIQLEIRKFDGEIKLAFGEVYNVLDTALLLRVD